MTICPRCHKENEEGAQHCVSCRAYLGWTRGRRDAAGAPAAPVSRPASPAAPPAHPPTRSGPPAAPRPGVPAPDRPPGAPTYNPPPGAPQYDPPPGAPQYDPPPGAPQPAAPARPQTERAAPARPDTLRPVAHDPWSAGSPSGPVGRVPERTIGVRTTAQPQRIAPRSPFGDVAEPAAAPNLGAVLPQETVDGPTPQSPSGRVASPAWSAPPGAGERACPQCGRGVGADRRFCRCGAQLTAPRTVSDEAEAPPRLPWYRRIGDSIGTGRGFRRAMRSANGGLRVNYDRALAVRAQLVRATFVLGAAGLAVSQLGPWGPDLRDQAYQRIDRYVPHRYAAVPTDTVGLEPAANPVPGFDVGYAVDGNADRAWAAPWVPAAGGGQPCQRAGGAPALTIAFRRPATIERVVIQSGLAKTNDKRTLQFRPRQVDLLFSDGTCAEATLTDDAGPQTITVKATDVAHARVVIVDAYPPADKGDGLVSLSEISFSSRR